MKSFLVQTALFLGVSLLFLLLSPVLKEGINPYLFQILMVMGINITLAISLTLINGITGQFSIGHAGFMALGAYGAGGFSVFLGPKLAALGLPPLVSQNLWLVVSILFGGGLAALAGLIIGMPTLRLRGDYLAIATLGFGEIIRVVITNLDFVGGARGLIGIPTTTNFFWVYFVCLLCGILVYRLSHTPRGLALSAVREDEIAATSIGINTTRYKVAAFITGAFFAGVAGGLFAHFFGYINPQSFTFVKSFELVVMIVLGGLGSITGAVVGAVLLTLLPEFLRAPQAFIPLPLPEFLTGFLGQVSQYRLLIYSLLLIVLMLTRPQGIFGRREFSLARFLGRKGTEP
ncbi:MAG: branched-chain amino acid ABC transporter permease [Verrucomicrobiae bacterium]|nr:branched-chain amino acid ABC transporter permease [Verrucomicrobiae bacterium]